MPAHWGWFRKDVTPTTCLTMAQRAIVEYGLHVDDAADGGGGYIVLGSGPGDLVVQVTCAPDGDRTWVAVTAWCPDSRTAELARNGVRETIVHLVPIE